MPESLKSIDREEISNDIEFVVWQKNHHKLQRDFFLSLAAMLSTAIVVLVAYWTDKYDKMLESKNREIKSLQKS